MSTESQSTKSSMTFPYYSLKACLEIGEVVRRMGGSKGGVTKDALASELKTSVSSASLSQKVTSAKHFGILEGGKAYNLTERAKHYFFPSEDSDKRRALFDLFKTPELFDHLLKQYDGEQLPSVTQMGNLLARERLVAESWSNRAASLFVNGARDLQIVDAQGFLRYGAAIADKPLAAGDVKAPNDSNDNRGDRPADVPARGTGGRRDDTGGENASGTADVWVFSHKGRTVRLETPADMPLVLWERLAKYVEIIKPTEEGKQD